MIARALPERRLAFAWLVLGAGLAALGFDETAEIHERLESRTGASAAVVLAPLSLLLAGAGLVALPSVRRNPPALWFALAGGATWVVSQALAPIHGVVLKGALEETLEIGGSALIVLAALRIARGEVAPGQPESGSRRSIRSSRAQPSSSTYS